MIRRACALAFLSLPMTENNHSTIRKKFRLRRLRRRLFSFLKKSLPWLVGGLVILWAVGFFLLAPVAEGKISNLCGGAVYVKSGRFKGFGGVRLKGVVIAENADGLVNAPVFRFDEIDVMFDPWELLRGKLKVRSIRLSDFLFNATYDRQERWNFSSLLSQRSDSVSEKIPLIEVCNGAMRISRIEENRPKAITTVSLNGQVAVQTGKREYSFSLITDGRFGFGGSELSGLLKLGRPGEKSSFAAEGKIQMPKTKVFENAWNLDDVRLELEFDRRQVLVKRCGFTMGDGDVDIRGMVRNDDQDQQELNLDVSLRNLRLSDHYEKNTIVYSEPVLELLDPGLRRFLNGYHPIGMGDLKLSIQGHLEDLSATVANGLIVCRDISVRDEDFPYLLEKMQGRIVLSGRNLELNQLRASHGDVNLQIDGSIQNMGPGAEIDLRTTSPNMLFDADLYQALNDSVKKVWFSFTPSGETEVDYHFQRFANGKKDFMLTLELTKAGLVYEHFPYPLENLTGTVVITSDNVQIKELVSHYGDERKITLDAQVFELGSQPEFQVHVQAKQIPVDDLLVNAMPSQQDFFDKLDIDAIANIEVDVFPKVVGNRLWDYTAKVQVDGRRFVYSDFPIPMEDIHLTADVTHDVVDLHRFNGMTSGGQVVMSGKLTPKGVRTDQPGLCLELGLEHFDFNELFWNAAGQDAERILGKLRMQGRMNVSGQMAMNFPADSCSRTDLVIQCSDNPVSWGEIPLGQAFGQLHLKDDILYFEEFSLKGIQLESIPEELLEGRLKGVYSGIQPKGEVHFRIAEGKVQMGEIGPDRIDIEGGVGLKNVAAGHENFINGLVGDVDAHLEFNRAKKTWQALASCDINHLNYRQWLISNFRGDFAYDPNTKHFEGTDIIADLYDGRIIGDIEVDLSGEDKIGYRLGFSLNDVDLPQLLAADGKDTLDRVKQGRAFGALNLEGDLKSPSQSRGKVTAHVVNMKLGKQSIMGKILTAMQFRQPDEYVFSEFKAEAFIRQSQLIIEDIRMVGKPLVFRGKGKLDLKQKQIEIDLVAFDRLLGTEDTILDLLARGIGSAVWKVEVRGDMNNPKVDAVFLSVLKQPLELFKKKE